MNKIHGTVYFYYTAHFPSSSSIKRLQITTVSFLKWHRTKGVQITVDRFFLFSDQFWHPSFHCRNRQGRMGGDIAYYVRKRTQCEKLSLKNCHKQVESWWIKIRSKGNKGNLVVGVSYRQPDQGKTNDEVFLLQLEAALCLQALVLLGDFQLPWHVLEKQHSKM